MASARPQLRPGAAGRRRNAEGDSLRGMLPHWPSPRALPRTRGLGGLSDFQDLVSSDPNFSSAWGSVQKQLTAEGSTDLTGAKLAMSDSFSQLVSQSFGMSPEDAANYAKNYVVLGQSVLGAVSTVQGLISTVESGTPTQIAQAFTGTMIGIAVAAGTISAGIGAAIAAVVEIAVGLLQEAGLFGKPPAATLCGGPLNTIPIFTVGCVAAYVPATSPGSADWRAFPLPTTDPEWYSTQTSFTWGGGRWIVSAPGWGDGGAAVPIDSAFGQFGTIKLLGPEGIFGPTSFAQAFQSAWQANAAYALNGLTPQPDWQVLVHTLRLWNKAHSGSSVMSIKPTPSQPPSCDNSATSLIAGPSQYIASLASCALTNLSATDAIVSEGNLVLNTGAMLNPPNTGPVQWTTVATDVAAGAAVVGGTALLGVSVYALVKGKTIGAVAHGMLTAIKGWF